MADRRLEHGILTAVLDRPVKGVREMKRHMAGKPVWGARITELSEPDVRAIRRALQIDVVAESSRWPKRRSGRQSAVSARRKLTLPANCRQWRIAVWSPLDQ
jgi:hypothetical protein